MSADSGNVEGHGLREAVEAVLDDHERIEDFELDLTDGSDDRRVLDQCHCAHCDGDGPLICPMAVQKLINNHLCALRDRVQSALDAQPEAAESTICRDCYRESPLGAGLEFHEATCPLVSRLTAAITLGSIECMRGATESGP